MAKCPKCEAEIEEDFGLVTCPECHAQVMLPIDDAIEMESPSEEELDAPQFPLVQSESDLEAVDSDQFESILDSNLIEGISTDASSEPIEPAIANDAEVGSPSEVDQSMWPADFRPVNVKSEPPTNREPADMSDVLEYANSTESQGKDGLLLYDLYLGGIDSAEVRGRLKELIADEKLKWDLNEIMNQIDGGNLILKRVSAVKASILVQKLRLLPISIRWEQHAIYES